jgi:uncharacterized membrane protein YbhN (UPF0104 family)
VLVFRFIYFLLPPALGAVLGAAAEIRLRSTRTADASL